VKITVIHENSLETEKLCSFETGYSSSGLQNIFYSEKTNIIFVIDGNGIYIKSFQQEKDEFKMIGEYYRGQSQTLITSLCTVNDKHFAISSSNRTIHLFQIYPDQTDKNNKIQNAQHKRNDSYFSFFYNFLTNPFHLNKSIIKIRLDDIILKKEKEEEGINNQFFNFDFKTKGSILIFQEETQELICLCYNGQMFSFKIDLEKLDYSMTNKSDWCLINEQRVSHYYSEDTSLDLYVVNKSTNHCTEMSNIDNWKII
jgi:hypothetical protein